MMAGVENGAGEGRAGLRWIPLQVYGPDLVVAADISYGIRVIAEEFSPAFHRWVFAE